MINLHDYHCIVINSSAGKDSVCAIWEINRMAEEQGYPKEQIVVSHQDLGRMEWKGVRMLAEAQANMFGFKFVVTKRKTKDGVEETLLDYARRRGKWPSNKQRWCTSDFKRAPGRKVVTRISAKLKGMVPHQRFLYVFGFRSEESPARAKKQPLVIHKGLTIKSRTVHECCPILDWSTEKVWEVIKSNNLPYHRAYDLGMPRLSCVFCIFSPKDALVIAGRANKELLEEYVQTEIEIGHKFRLDVSMQEIKELVYDNSYKPKNIPNWVM